MGGPARSWMSIICETVRFPAMFPQQGLVVGDAVAILTHPTGTPTLAICPQGLCTDFPVKALLLFYHYVKNVSS